MSVIHAPRKQSLELRYVVFLIGVFGALLTIFLRLWYLQVAMNAELSEKAESYRTSSTSSLAPRGIIEDRNGKVLASVKPETVVTAIPSVIQKEPWVLAKLAALLGVPEEKLKQKLSENGWRPYLPAPIHVGVSPAVATRIAEAGGDLPGINVESQPMRTYADTLSLAHILGYVWTPSEKDVKRLEAENIKPPQYVGKIGLEYIYEKDLMGVEGRESLETDAKGRPMRVVGRDNPRPGSKLTLTIDYDLQKLANELLAEALKDMGAPGAIVAIDPRNGEVLCLASSPTYDTALFQNGISSTDWERLRGNPQHPMTNRAIYGTYAPGSTFKIVTALAAEQTGQFSAGRTAVCRGYYEVGNRKFRCLGNHGAITFLRAMTKSCNAYFMDLGIKAGREGVVTACESMGLGHRSGIDLLGEGRGTVPTEEWIRAVQKVPEGKPFTWYLGNTANISIGQGDVGATPLQMANVAAMVANNGVVYRPHLVRTIQSTEPNGKPVAVTPEVLYRVEVSSGFWPLMKQALVSVIQQGTATGGTSIPGVTWGGKTGSSEHSRKGTKTHSWFVGIAPMDDPQIVIAAVVESAGHGGEVAAPLAAKIVRKGLVKGEKPARPATGN
ncbi:MAG TPA: penicillin-binding protein 2 [Fimbriimonadaceae bacterium]|nr:penicillin-binding protein 2 [Fimbriimonadaceae bacterium]